MAAWSLWTAEVLWTAGVRSTGGLAAGNVTALAWKTQTPTPRHRRPGNQVPPWSGRDGSSNLTLLDRIREIAI
ncbi:hypothetical protein PHAMO_80044 [Magnetospirillum molischianum DSM 120]|uniref:Uncharacterized protein n=1 Tax=Magnetospirillum molischianum DSM 120 TaxID=1150626 RepID=H8FY15_MAGML|nr:hypothetical protein PHAMO_80044 [Magnetospirillum molischianum DSM 120]